MTTPPRGGGGRHRQTRWSRAWCRGAKTLLAILAIAVAAAVQAQTGQPIVALPQHATGGTDDLYYLDLGGGALTHGDQLRRDPLTMRARRMGQNLFQEIGRPVDQPAAFDEVLLGPIRSSGTNVRAVLLVESSTGYVAFFDQLGKNGAFGRFSSAIGRPFAPIAGAGGNYALLMRHGTGGRTEGAYLYHAGSGRVYYLDGVAKLRTDAEAVAVSGFPQLSGQVAAAELQFSDRTVGYAVADAADGALRFLDLESARRLTVRDSPVGLFPLFDAEAPGAVPQRFVAAPIRNRGETTTHVLFVDAASGDMAVLAGVEDGAQRPTLTRLAANVYGALGTTAGSGSRVLAAVPNRAGDGSTGGVWLIDSLTRGAVYVEGAETPGSATVRRVVVGG